MKFQCHIISIQYEYLSKHPYDVISNGDNIEISI